MFEQRKKLDKKLAIGKPGANMELMGFVAQKEKGRRVKEERIKRKNDLKTEWEKNKENIRVMEEKVDLVKSKLTFVKEILKEYYINLLKQGTDTRYSMCIKLFP